jgi:SpoVK/Ycf46/Vps4 family AAA+-type ATPase
MHVQWVSAQDLLVRASWATEDDLLDLIVPQKSEKRCLLVIDDLQVLASEEEEDSLYDPELLLVHNSILEALDRLSTVTPSPFILGIAREASQLPKGLVKIGRLEKERAIEPPSQVQREEIIASILEDVTDNVKRRRWSETLASQTAGCVASDLRRLSADAWTRAWSRSPDNVEITWNDLRGAAHNCVPSQLAQLDVTKTPVFPHEGDGPPDPLKIHEWSWRNFGGYHEVKKRLYRTVVMPWRRSIANENDEIRDRWVTPPSGVLFHGSPGVGKTVAASCLASSLELQVVKVRVQFC